MSGIPMQNKFTSTEDYELTEGQFIPEDIDYSKPKQTNAECSKSISLK